MTSVGTAEAAESDAEEGLEDLDRKAPDDPKSATLGYEQLLKSMPMHDPFQRMVDRGISAANPDDLRRIAAQGLTDQEQNTKLTTHVILSADIRKSTFLMKEASDLSVYAGIMTSFINHSKKLVADHGGWFDKFMGDGFLAYWPCELYLPQTHIEDGARSRTDARLSDALVDISHTYIAGEEWKSSPTDFPVPNNLGAAKLYGVASALRVSTLLVDAFTSRFLPGFRRTTRNLRADTGLTVGIDVGDVLLVSMGSEMSIVGHPIVGAVRMTSGGLRGEVIANMSVESAIRSARLGESAAMLSHVNTGHRLSRFEMDTKEYRLEAYRVSVNSKP